MTTRAETLIARACLTSESPCRLSPPKTSRVLDPHQDSHPSEAIFGRSAGALGREVFKTDEKEVNPAIKVCAIQVRSCRSEECRFMLRGYIDKNTARGDRSLSAAGPPQRQQLTSNSTYRQQHGAR
ncbi:hypothetical protein VC83_03295 [Pseudogymnoascus destructans]|uniref:Uncharacterized protein n=1 Tax=Pseudogymnoascus destructans TaxID=655981 RepID=A0A177AHA7_9PEZI|nr:uncharacterized protein VC83_03295 [Pseudogymnoascus destructans]OAF60564.1 hypothetical protein VC83_03295 [Pseudogymnoascus destructans]